MYQQEYYVRKDSGTYSNVLEAFGLATILSRIVGDKQDAVRMIDNATHYTLRLSETLTEDKIKRIMYFDGYPYIRSKDDKPPKGISFITYEDEKRISDDQRTFEKKKWEEFKKGVDNVKKQRIRKEIDDYEPKRSTDWDILSSINKLKALPSYRKLFLNVIGNRDVFPEFLKAVLQLYSSIDDQTSTVGNNLKKLEKQKKLEKLNSVNALQMFNPHQGKGVNAPKATGIAMGGEAAFWVREYLKMVGCYKAMFVRPIQVSPKKWDTKIYVLSPKDVDYNQIVTLYNAFKPTLGGNTSIKVDIASVLRFCQAFITNIEEYQKKVPFRKRYQPHYFVGGFYVAYLKKLGTSEAVSNLSFLELPPFIEIHSQQDGDDWIEILDHYMMVFTGKSISESGTGLEVLHQFREFVTMGSIDSFLNAHCSHAVFLSQELNSLKEKDKRNFISYNAIRSMLFEKVFQLTKEYYMTVTNEKPLAPIFQSEGFKNMAKAIRSSTISLQYTPKSQRSYEIRYGIAQDLKRKSPYRQELVEYLSEFSASYNTENARVKERKGEAFVTRANVKQQDIEEVISLIDEYGSSVIGKLLAAYGYALDRKDKIKELEPDNQPDSDEADSEDR